MVILYIAIFTQRKRPYTAYSDVYTVRRAVRCGGLVYADDGTLAGSDHTDKAAPLCEPVTNIQNHVQHKHINTHT